MRTLALALLAAACWGCDAAPPTLPDASAAVPVKGRITHKGKPLTAGRITFEPTDGGRDARGDIQADGTFVLGTSRDDDGAEVGVHRVLISGVEPPPRTRGETHVRVTAGKSEYAVDLK